MSSELIGLYDIIARLMSIALQHGASPLEKVGDLLPEAKLILAAGIWRLSAGGSGPVQTT
ncbi:MAG TPA: hypothetical protein VK598_06595 [Nitrospiraceae bacterium]|nr:hypothetical protein [Nitrospiraceae bacterium]